MINYGYINHQTKNSENRPILQTNWPEFVYIKKNEDNFREKKILQKMLNPSLLMEVCI